MQLSTPAMAAGVTSACRSKENVVKITVKNKNEMKKTLLLIAAFVAATGSMTAATESTDTIKVVYSGTTAQVTIPSAVASYVSCSSGTSSHVVLTQSGNSIELVYSLSGTSTNGSFLMTGSYKTTVCLDGLTLTNGQADAALNIQNGKRVKIKAVEGTVSTLTDGTGGQQKGCLVVKGHTEFRGKGTLNVYGKTAHGIKSGEYISVKNSVINVKEAVKDAFNCNEYFCMESGTITIDEAGDDGIQVDVDTDAAHTGETTDHEDENSGNFYMLDGQLTIADYEGKAIKAGGTVTLVTRGCSFDTTDIKENTYATAISAVTLPATAVGEAIHDLSGRRLPAAHRSGIYVVTEGGRTVKRLFK